MQTKRFKPMVLVLALIALMGSLLVQAPAMAMTGRSAPLPLAARIMAKDTAASAKQVEGRLQAVRGDLTGDTGDKIKGQAKQVQASAMQAGSDLKQGVKSTVSSVGDATSRAAGKIQ